MSKRIFTKSQINELLKNKNVDKCSEKSITYNKEFKVQAVTKYYQDSYSPRMIFEEALFDLKIIGENVPRQSLHRWRKVYKNKGIDSLKNESRGYSHRGGRPKVRNVSDTDKIKRLEIENAYLKAENDFLVKLRAARKR